MKKFLVFIFLIPLAFACKESEIQNENLFDFNGTVQVKHGQILQSDHSDISMQIININDSRCPSDVVCVWEGEARITIEFINTKTSTFELSTSEPKDTVDNYIFTLMDVAPYPVSTEILELEDYTIKLDVEEL